MYPEGSRLLPEMWKASFQNLKYSNKKITGAWLDLLPPCKNIDTLTAFLLLPLMLFGYPKKK